MLQMIWVYQMEDFEAYYGARSQNIWYVDYLTSYDSKYGPNVTRALGVCSSSLLVRLGRVLRTIFQAGMHLRLGDTPSVVDMVVGQRLRLVRSVLPISHPIKVDLYTEKHNYTGFYL